MDQISVASQKCPDFAQTKSRNLYTRILIFCNSVDKFIIGHVLNLGLQNITKAITKGVLIRNKRR
jgi:hypothetical protein